MGIFKLAKLSTQVGLAGATVYYANEFKLFGDHSQTTGGYKQLKDTVGSNEYYKEYAAPIVDQGKEGASTSLASARDYLPNMPTAQCVTNTWNWGVMTAFSGLANLPANVSHYSVEAYDLVAKQLESDKTADAVQDEVKKTVEEEAAAKVPEEKTEEVKPVEEIEKEKSSEPVAEEPVTKQSEEESPKKKSGWFG